MSDDSNNDPIGGSKFREQVEETIKARLAALVKARYGGDENACVLTSALCSTKLEGEKNEQERTGGNERRSRRFSARTQT